MVKEKYPELATYLCGESGVDGEIDTYLAWYRKNKIINRFPGNYAKLLSYDRFDARFKQLAKMNGKDCFTLWIDGFGMEWLPVFLKELELVGIKPEYKNIGTAKLPTETEYNHQWDTSDPLCEKWTRLDSYSHKGMPDDKSYYSCIVYQLSVFKEAAKRVDELLDEHEYVAITGDHGSSRLAALAFHDPSIIPVVAPKNSKIRSFGRFCELPDNGSSFVELDYMKKVTLDDKTYVVMRDYSQFSVSGNVAGGNTDDQDVFGETHGGDTPEERLVPVVIVKRSQPLPPLACTPKSKFVTRKNGHVEIELTFNRPVSSLEVTTDTQITGVCSIKDNGSWMVSFDGVSGDSFSISVVVNGKRGYDNVAIDTFAYRYTRTTPTNVKPLDNVIVRLCTIECCFSHALDDETCPENAALMQDLINWNSICNRLYVWDYTTNYANTLGIFPDFGVIQRNAQVFFENGVKGVYEEGNYYIDGCDTEFGELRAYLLSKCLQDPYCDIEAVTADFLKGYYGAGRQNIKEFIDIISADAAKGHVKIYNTMADSLFLSDDEVKKCDELWASAKEACTDETQLANIERSELSWRFWKASTDKGEFSSLFGGAADRKALFEDIIAAGTKQASEGGGELKTAPLYQFSSADAWFGDGTGTIVKLILIIAWIFFGIAVLLSFIVFIKGIKVKSYVCCFLFPLLAASAELALWHRRAYLAWKDLDQYAISLVIACLVFAFMGFVLAKAKKEKGKKLALTAFIGFAAFIVPYELATTIINNAIFHGSGNQLAIAVAYLICAVSMFVIELLTVKRVIRNKK